MESEADVWRGFSFSGLSQPSFTISQDIFFIFYDNHIFGLVSQVSVSGSTSAMSVASSSAEFAGDELPPLMTHHCAQEDDIESVLNIIMVIII